MSPFEARIPGLKMVEPRRTASAQMRSTIIVGEVRREEEAVEKEGQGVGVVDVVGGEVR